jgi:hypothetical protein
MMTRHTPHVPTAHHDIETDRRARSRPWMGPVGVVAFAGVAIVGTALYADGDRDASSRAARASNVGDSTQPQVLVHESRGDPRGPSDLWPTALVPQSQLLVRGDPRGPSDLWPTALVPQSQVLVRGDPRGPSDLWPTK